MNAQRLSLLAVCLAALTLPALAIDWPQWRGPDRTGVSQETGLLKSWPKDGPKLLWTNRDGGQGYSSPAVVGDRLYTMGSDGKNEFVFAVDVQTGNKIWSTPIFGVYTEGHGDGPRGTPAVDGDLLYALSGKGELACLKVATGEKVWSKNLVADLGGTVAKWGYTESPLIDGDQVICTPGGPKGSLAALNKKTGEVVWQSDAVKDSQCYSSAIIAELDGVRQYVQMTSKGIVGISPKDGKVLWNHPLNYGVPARVATPIVRDGLVFASIGYGGGGCELVKPVRDSQGNFKAEKVWANRSLGSQVGGVVLVGGVLYGHSDPGKGWMCVDFKTGASKEPNGNLDKGSVTSAEGLLYCYGQNNGEVSLVEPSKDGLKEISRFAVPEKSKVRKGGAKFWTHPVVCNGRLYVREQDLLFCYDVKAK